MIAGLLVRVGRIIIVTLVVTFLTALLMDQLRTSWCRWQPTNQCSRLKRR